MASFLNKLTGNTSSHPSDQEQSLGTILPGHDDRSEFLLLLANCMALMRNQTVGTFDPRFDGQAWDYSLSASQDDVSITNVTNQQSVADDRRKSQERSANETDGQRRKAHEYRIQELAQPSMLDLKQAAIEHFDVWRDKVIQRLDEVINQHPISESNAINVSAKQLDATIPAQSSSSMGSAEVDSIAQQLYPKQTTRLINIPEPQRILLLHSLLLLLLSLQSYSAESRVLMLYVTSSLGLSLELLVQDETHIAAGLLDSANAINADEEKKKDAEAHSSSRKWKVGLGATAGAVLVGVTGGLAAPFLAAGVGSVMGGIGLASTATAGYLGAMAGSAPLVGALFGAYGGRMTARIVDEYAREVEDFAFIPLHRHHVLHNNSAADNKRHLRVAICVSGYLTEEAEVTKPWRAIGTSIEGFALRYELKSLLALGSALSSYVKSYAWGWAKKEIISRTIFATLSSAIGAALALPYGIAKATKLVDNPFNRAKSRSEKAGRVLARALIAKVQGERPVTLLGYSLGARVIYCCLDELANQKAFGLVESVVLAGAAAPSDSVTWRKMRSVVSGRIINAYSTKDYLLLFLYRASSLQYGVAGLQAIQDVPGIENVDVSDLVDGHTQYRFMMSQILQKVELEDIDASEVDKQMKEMQLQREKDEAELERNQASGMNAEEHAQEMEQELYQGTKKSK